MIDAKGDVLAAQALLYASGELDPGQELAFERLLSQDQRAREALTRAAQVVFAVEPSDWQRPYPEYRRRVVEFLAPRPWYARWWGRRAYRGHPAAWAVLGAAASLLVVLGLQAYSGRAGQPDAALAKRPIANVLPDEPAALPGGEELVSVEQAELWVLLPRPSEHLQKVHEEELRRRQIEGKLGRLKKDDNRPRY